MTAILHHRQLGVAIVVLLIVYTLHLVRSDRLSAHLAISWIVAELGLLAVIASDRLVSMLQGYFGEESTLFGALMLGAAWMVFLMLDNLVRISSLGLKLTQAIQELALLRQRLEEAERNSGTRT